MSDADITKKLMELLHVRYAEPEWLLWEELSMDGWGRVDAIAINAYQSSGHVLHGFEVKASRRDWLNELKRMAKSNAAFTYCDRWYLVAAKGVVMPDELPKTWGLLEMSSTESQLTTKVRAPVLMPEKQLTMSHMVRMARRSRRQESVDERIQKAYLEGRTSGIRSAADAQKYETARDASAAATLRAFEEALGMSVSSFNIAKIVEAVTFALRGEDQIKNAVGLARARAKSLLESTEWAAELDSKYDRW